MAAKRASIPSLITLSNFRPLLPGCRIGYQPSAFRVLGLKISRVKGLGFRFRSDLRFGVEGADLCFRVVGVVKGYDLVLKSLKVLVKNDPHPVKAL